MTTVTDANLRSMWRAAGGAFHGPHVETGTMPEAKLLPFLRALVASSPAPSWRPIETAPMNRPFYIENQYHDMIRVRRHAEPCISSKICVVHLTTGVIYYPDYWCDLAVAPEPPVTSAPSWQSTLTHWQRNDGFRFGDTVEKTKGSSWHGKVVGFYSTTLTPFGYAVESVREPGSVQIYPEAALRTVTPEPQAADTGERGR